MKASLLKKLTHFPPPRFLTMPSVGFNLSDHSAKVVELGERGAITIPSRWASVPIPDGVVVDGDIKKPDELEKVLSSMTSELGLEFVRASIPEEQAYIYNTEVPLESLSHLNEVIEFQLQDHVPLSPSEAVFDCDVIEVNKKKKTALVNVSVLPRHVIDEYMNIFSRSGLIPLSFEMEGQTVARAVIERGNEGTYMIADIGRTRTGISIITNGILAYTSTISFGGDIFVHEFMKSENITYKDADKKKREEGLTYAYRNEETGRALREAVEMLVLETNKRISYWYSHQAKKDPKRALKQLILAGGNATTPGLKDHLESTIDIPVRFGNVWTNLFSFDEHIPQIDFKHSLGYASAIGLALSDE